MSDIRIALKEGDGGFWLRFYEDKQEASGLIAPPFIISYLASKKLSRTGTIGIPNTCS